MKIALVLLASLPLIANASSGLDPDYVTLARQSQEVRGIIRTFERSERGLVCETISVANTRYSQARVDINLLCGQRTDSGAVRPAQFRLRITGWADAGSVIVSEMRLTAVRPN